jgi:hypothetical protein
MSEQMKPREFKYVNGSVVYEDEQGYYMNATITTESWNDYLRRYEKSGTRIEKIRPAEMDLLKRAEQKIYILKKVSSSESLSDEEIAFNCTLVWEFPDEARYKPFFFYISKRSGEVFIKQLDSGVASSAGVNSEFVKRTKIEKCQENTRIPKDAAVFLLNPSTNELERKLPDAV